MAALQCEICGGKLMAKSGGLFECEYCGMQYDKTRIQEMVQEIKGTVKVEGTVEVKGTVKLDGPVEIKGSTNVEGLLKRGWMAIEDRQYDEAKNCFNQALQINPEVGQAYFGIAMATVGYSTIPRLAEAADFRFKQYIDRARQYPDEKVRVMLQEYDSLKAAEKLRKEEQKIREEAEREQRKQAEKAELEANRKRKEEYRKLLETMKGKIAVSNSTTVAVKSDRTVLASGANDCGQSNVSHWNDVIAVSAEQDHTIGLKSNGTVVAAGNQKTGVCDVHSWSNVVKISTSSNHTLGLCSNGRVCCTTLKGWTSKFGQDAVSSWQDIVDIAAADHVSIGIRKDGKLLYSGYLSRYDQRIDTLTDFVSADAGYNTFIALRSNGTAISFNHSVDYGLKTDHWTKIVQVAAGYDHVVGLKGDGTVVAKGKDYDGECNVSGWSDVVAVAAGFRCTVGLKKDGRILSAGYTRVGVDQWRLFQKADTFTAEEENALAVLKEKHEATKEKLKTEKAKLSWELGQLKGLFTGKRRKEIEARLNEIENELKGRN